MIRRFSQMSKEEWPKGLTMAVAKLCLEPDQLMSQFGMQFFEDRDDLDAFRAALIRVDERHEYAFVRYLGSSDPGTEVWVPEDCADVAPRLRLLWDTLSVSADSISWLHPQFDSETKASAT